VQTATGLRKRKHVRGERLLAVSSRKLVLLAPSPYGANGHFDQVHADSRGYEERFAEMQRLRGSVYLQMGAVKPEQLTAGRHQLPIDEGSWHLLALDQDDRVCGCARYRKHPNQTRFSQLSVADSALARSAEWSRTLRAAVESELALSRRMNLPFVELGGWALSEESRGTTVALRMALAVYSLSQAWGGAVGITMANTRNCCASILRRIGGRPLRHEDTELPVYHDPHYDLELEVLRFYSWDPSPRYAFLIREMKARLRAIPVITKSFVRPALGLGWSPSPPHPLAHLPLQFQPPTAVQ
jgi:hypothetical protein